MTKITKRLSPTNILNIFAKTNQILDVGIQPLLNILICNLDKVVIFKGELKSKAVFVFFFSETALRCFTVSSKTICAVFVVLCRV